MGVVNENISDVLEKSYVGESIRNILNDLVHPIEEIFKSVTLTYKEKVIIANIVLAILFGTISSGNSQFTNEPRYDTSSLGSPEMPVKRFCVTALNGNTVNVRSGPGINHRILSAIEGDDILDIVGEDPVDGWYKIRTDDGSDAYISADYTSIQECEGAVNSFESNSHFVRISKLDFNGISVFNIEATQFAPQVLSRLVEVVRARANEYPGARGSNLPLAIVFGEQDKMFKLLPDLKHGLELMSQTDERFASLDAAGVNDLVTVTPDGSLVATAYGYEGTTYEMAFIQVYEGEELLSQIYSTTAHELVHALGGPVSMHRKLANGTFDYTLDNPAEREEHIASLSIDGVLSCSFYSPEFIEACEQYALALFGNDDKRDLIVYPQGTLNIDYTLAITGDSNNPDVIVYPKGKLQVNIEQ